MHARAAQPLVAACGSAHARPQPPQCDGSTVVSAQKAAPAAPQVASGAAHVAPHAPPEQTWPAAQAVPQLPQCAPSVAVLTSQPSAGSRLQSAYPAAQAVSTHAPAVQAVVACGSAQARPQAPQWAALVAVGISQPLAADPSQSPKPAAQRTTTHVPSVHPAAEAFASAHVVAQLPQCAGSMDVSAQRAPAPLPQVTSGAAQVVPHTPPEHTRPAGHAAPQAPQLALSVCRLVHMPPQLVRPAPQTGTHAPAVHPLPGGQARPHAPQ